MSHWPNRYENLPHSDEPEYVEIMRKGAFFMYRLVAGSGYPLTGWEYGTKDYDSTMRKVKARFKRKRPSNIRKILSGDRILDQWAE